MCKNLGSGGKFCGFCEKLNFFEEILEMMGENSKKL